MCKLIKELRKSGLTNPLFCMLKKEEMCLANSVENTALKLGDKIAEEQGVFLVDASFDKEKDGNFLRLYIDKDGGVGIDDCEAFSIAFDKAFDENIINTNYCLEVSSPGVDRELKKEREFLYYVGREVDVKLYSAVDGMKEFTAQLLNYENETIKLLVGQKEIDIPKSKTVYVRLSFKF